MLEVSSIYGTFDSVLSIFLYVTVAIAIVLAAFVRDFEFIRKSPVKFLLECVVLFLLPAVPLLMFMYTQGIDKSVIFKWIKNIGTKLVVLHLFFTISGLYNIWFEKEYAHPGTERED